MRITQPRNAALAAATAAVLLLAGCGGAEAGDGGSRPDNAADEAADDADEAADGRGTLVGAERLYTLRTPQDAADELTSAGFDDAEVRYGVDAYQLVYRTIDAEGQPTTASGLLALPRTPDTPLTPVSFAHGTGINKDDAPSMERADFVSAATVGYAAAGFAGIAPDYVGMGLGPGPHPWMDVPSETTASLDMLRAARAFVPRADHELARDVMVTGFSQGASAALGLGWALQAGEDPHFRLAGLAPVAGAYDFGGTELPALFEGGEIAPKYGVVYAAYTLVAFNRLHGGLYEDPGEVFLAPYDRDLEELFDSTHTGEEVMAATPGTLDELLTPYGRELLSSPTGSFADALRTTGGVCTDWTPRAPTRLYLAPDDEQAVTDNTLWCEAELRENGAEVSVVDLGEVEYEGSRHLGASVAAAAETIPWFRELASG